MFLCQTEKVQIRITKTNHISSATNIQYISHLYINAHILSLNTFIWNCIEYSMVSRIYFYIPVVIYSCLVSVQWAAQHLLPTVLYIFWYLSVCAGIGASPSRLLLLFKGLAAPSPLKQKEKRDWVRLRSPTKTPLQKLWGERQHGVSTEGVCIVQPKIQLLSGRNGMLY